MVLLLQLKLHASPDVYLLGGGPAEELGAGEVVGRPANDLSSKTRCTVSVDAEGDGVAAAESVHATGFLPLRWWKSNIFKKNDVHPPLPEPLPLHFVTAAAIDVAVADRDFYIFVIDTVHWMPTSWVVIQLRTGCG